MIFLGLWVIPAVTGCSKASEPRPAITKAERTAISPHLEAQIDSTKNMLYCASFQIAWDKMCKQVIKEDIRLQGNPLTAQQLNRQSLSNSDISSGSYVAEAGAYSKELVERINRELQEKLVIRGGTSKCPKPQPVIGRSLPTRTFTRIWNSPPSSKNSPHQYRSKPMEVRLP